MIKRILFLIFSIIFFIFAFLYAKPPEADLMKAFINPHSQMEKNIVKLAGISSTTVNVFGTDEIPNNNQDFSEILDVYREYPANFLSAHKRELLKNRQYRELENEALEGIYSPLGFYAAPIDKDPYLLATDFLISKNKNEAAEFEGKTYQVSRLKIQNTKELESLIEDVKGKDIYLTGTPVHSYFASKKSSKEINIICIISILGLIVLSKIFFHSVKVLIPIVLSIIFGFLFGFSACTFVFGKLHVLTFVFSTSLIGISLDYVLHYFYGSCSRGFKTGLTSSMLTTITAFLTLLFSNIEVLRQIAIFTSFGLLGVYLFVIFILPCFKIPDTYNLNWRLRFPKKLFYTIILAVIAIGAFNIKFEDNLKNLYVPPKHLFEAEALYQKVFNPQAGEFLLIEGANLEEILEKEESIDGFGLSNFVSSTKRQNENLALVKELYNADLALLENKLGVKFNPSLKLYDSEKFPLNKEFMLDNTTSFVIVPKKTAGSFNIADEISKILKRLRYTSLKLLPVVFGMLFILLSCIYGVKKALKISFSPLLGVVFTVGVLSLSRLSLNLFHILGLFLILGFSLDYSIFRLNGDEKSNNAVFISFVSTALSFLLLSFTSFKLISSLGLTIFIGVTVSYISSLFMLKSEHEKI